MSLKLKLLVLESLTASLYCVSVYCYFVQLIVDSIVEYGGYSGGGGGGYGGNYGYEQPSGAYGAGAGAPAASGWGNQAPASTPYSGGYAGGDAQTGGYSTQPGGGAPSTAYPSGKH